MPSRPVRTARTVPIGSRVRPQVKAALDRAAMSADRSLAAQVERILWMWLADRGYIEPPPKDEADAGR